MLSRIWPSQSQSWFGAAPTLVINNAGVGSGGAPIGELPLDDWQWVLGINLWGPIHGCHVFAPILRTGDTASPAASSTSPRPPRSAPRPAWRAYNVSKAGVLSLSETLAAELSGSGVNVTVLCPTFVKTNIVEAGRISAGSTQLADRLMRLDRIHRGQGRHDLPGRPRPRRPVLHAAARRRSSAGASSDSRRVPTPAPSAC